MEQKDKIQVSNRLYAISPQPVVIPDDKRAAYSCFWIIGKNASARITDGFKVTKESISDLEENGYSVVTKTGTTQNVVKRFNQLGCDFKKYPSKSIDLASRKVAELMLADREAECVMFMVVVGLWGEPYNTTIAEKKVEDEFLQPLGCIPANQKGNDMARSLTSVKRIQVGIEATVPDIFP